MRPSVKIGILALATFLSLAWWKGLIALLDKGVMPKTVTMGEMDMPQKIKKHSKWEGAIRTHNRRIRSSEKFRLPCI